MVPVTNGFIRNAQDYPPSNLCNLVMIPLAPGYVECVHVLSYLLGLLEGILPFGHLDEISFNNILNAVY